MLLLGLLFLLTFFISSIDAKSHNFTDLPDDVTRKIAGWTHKKSFFALRHTNRNNFRALSIQDQILIPFNDVFTPDILNRWRNNMTTLHPEINLNLSLSLETMADRVMNNKACCEFWYLFFFTIRHLDLQGNDIILQMFPVVKVIHFMRKRNRVFKDSLTAAIENPQLPAKHKIYAYKEWIEQLFLNKLVNCEFRGYNLNHWLYAILFFNDMVISIESAKIDLCENGFIRYKHPRLLPYFTEISSRIREVLNVTHIDAANVTAILTRLETIDLGVCDNGEVGWLSQQNIFVYGVCLFLLVFSYFLVYIRVF